MHQNTALKCQDEGRITKGSSGAFNASCEIERSLSQHNVKILPDTMELMGLIQGGIWRTKIPEGIVDGVNKTVFIGRAHMIGPNLF